MAVQISVQASQTALAQSIAQGVATFNARYASQNQLNLQINGASFSQPLGRITGNLKEFESALAASNARVLAFGASTAVIGGVGKAFKEIADVTIEVEKSISDINRVLSLSTDKLQKFSSDLFAVSKMTASSFQDAAKASLEFSRQGLSAEDTLKKTADALTLVRLTGVSATQAVEDLTAATNAFKETGLTTNDILNKIVAVEQQFAVSADDLTSAVSRTGQAAKEAGVSFDQLNALVASAQEKTARGGAVIGNALKTIFTRLQRTETLDQLENFNISVRDIEGNVLPAIQILQNFAGAYKDLSTAQKASLSEQVAGVYQVNILKSIISDLNNQQGVYNKALEYGSKATNEAEQANAKLNLTLAALISQTGTNLQQLSNNIGKVTFEPVFKSLVSPFNDAITYINNLLEGEGIGSQFANGLLLGIKNILSGPGLVGAVAVIGKVITNTFSYASSALPALFGITTETQKRKNIEEAVLKIIQSQSQVSLALQGQQGNLVSQAQTLFNLAQAQTAQYQQQLATAKQLAVALAPRNITVGQAGLQVGKIKAGGYIPRDVQNAEVMGAAIGGYKAGKVINAPVGGVMNSAEKVKYIPGFAQPFINPPAGSKAGRMHRVKSINQTGVDPYAADGFLPNFARRKKTDSIIGAGFTGDLRELPLNKTDIKSIRQVANYRDWIGADYINDQITGKKGIYYQIKEIPGKTNKVIRDEARLIALSGSRQDLENNLPKNKLSSFDFDLWFTNRGLAKNDPFFPVKPLTKTNTKTTIPFESQLNGLLNLISGEIFEKRVEEKMGVKRSSVSNSRFDFAASDVARFLGGEAKVGSLSLGNLVAKAIGATGDFANENIDKIPLDLPIELYVPQPESKTSGLYNNGFIPNFAPSLSPKVTRLPWLKSFANKQWFDKFPWFNDIDLKNTHQNMDYNPYTGEKKLIPGSEMFRELNFLTHGNNKNIKTGNSPLFSYLYEEYVRDILNEVTKNQSIKDSEGAGFPMRDKDGNPTKFDPFKAANTAPMDALIRNKAGRIGGIEIKGGTEENWKTKDILKKEQDFEAQNPGSTLDRRTRVYSNMYKGTDFLTKGLLKRLGVDKAKAITNKLINFYADKISGHESEITNTWKASKGLSGGFVPNFADLDTGARSMLVNSGVIPFVIDLERKRIAESSAADDIFHSEIVNKKFIDPKTKKPIYPELYKDDIHSAFWKDTFVRGFVNTSTGKVDFHLTAPQKEDKNFMQKYSILLEQVRNKYAKKFEEAINEAKSTPQIKPKKHSPYQQIRKQLGSGPYPVNHFNNGLIPNFAKKEQAIPPRSKSTEPYRRGTSWWWETEKGYISAIQKAKNTYEIEGIEVYNKYKGQGESAKFYKGIAEKIGSGNNITGRLLPQEQALADYASGKPVPAKAIFPQLSRAKIAKSSKLSVNGKEMAISDFEKRIANHKYNASKLEMALIELVTSHASGFIPNFAYQQAVMSLEESMSGNKAILDTSTGPFPFVRNSSQPNFASAVADHGGVKRALSDSMAGQEAAGLMAAGNIPNFAAPDPITLTGKPFPSNQRTSDIEKAVNAYLKTIDALTITNKQINAQVKIFDSTLSLNNKEQKELRKQLVAHAQAEKVAAQRAAAPAAAGPAAVPLGPPNPTRLQAAQLKFGKFNEGVGKVGNSLAFALGAPLVAGQLESAITRGRDRSEMSSKERFAGSAISSGLTNISTGAALGTALIPILGPFGPAIGAATGALVGLATATYGASDNLEDLQKKAEKYRNQTQEAVQSGKGIIDTVKNLGNLDPNSLEAFDANQKLEEYFTKIAETGLDEKFREAGSDVEKMTEAIKAYEMERTAGAKRVAESASRMSRKDLSIEELGKKQILRTEKAAVTKYSQNQGLGGAPASYVAIEDVISSTGAAGEANFKKIVTQNSQLFADLENVQDQLGKNFGEFATEFKSQFSDLIFNQGELSDLLKKYNVTGIDADALAVQLNEVAKDNGEYGKFIVNNFDEIIKGLASGKYKTAMEAAKVLKEIAQRQEGVRQKLFQYSQAIEQSIASTAMQIENLDFEKNFGKLNLEKTSQFINDGLAAVSKNISDAFKNQFNFLIEQTSNLQQQKMLDFDAANFEKGFGLQKESRKLNRSKDLVSVLQGALEETASGNIEEIVKKFRETGTVDVSNISGLKKGEESKRAIESFNLTTRLSEEEFKNKDDNARKTFMAEQAYAQKSLELKKGVGKLDYELAERRYKNTLREKELVEQISYQNKNIQIKGQAEIERSRIPSESPYFMLGKGQFEKDDAKRKIESGATQKGFELEARQAIADAEIARIQRLVFEDNTTATLASTKATEDLIIALNKGGADAFQNQEKEINSIDSKILSDAEMQEIDRKIKSYKADLSTLQPINSLEFAKSGESQNGNPQAVALYNEEINRFEKQKQEQQELKEKKNNILNSKDYASNKASSSIYENQMQTKFAREELKKLNAKGGVFQSEDLSKIKDPIQYLRDQEQGERKKLQVLIEQKNELLKMEKIGKATEQSRKELASIEEKIPLQRTNVLAIENANLSILQKQTTERERQNQADKDKEKRGKFVTGAGKALDKIRSEIETFESDLGNMVVMNFRDGLVDAMDAAINKTDDLGEALMGIAGGFLKAIQNAMFQHAANQIVSGAMGFAGFKQKGGVIHAQAGMYISDAGRTGDVNPAMLEDGEYVLNRKTVKALGGSKEIDKLNFGAFPRFGAGTKRFADGGNTGSMQAAASMGEPFGQLSEFGKENNPEYQKYLEKAIEEQAKRDAKKKAKKDLIRSLVATAITTGLMMGVGALAKGMTGPKGATSGSAYGKTTAGKLESKASLFGSPEDMSIKQKGGVMHFANGGYLPYGNRLNDSIPALLSGGEYIVNSKSVRRYGVGGLNKINSGVARFEDGGLVGDAVKTNANTESSTSNNVSVNITVNATDGKAQNEQSSADGGDEKNRALGNKIKEVVLQVITNEQRTGGLLDSTKKK